MAMTMNGEVQLAANRDTVWKMLNDPAVLKACIPGCEQLDLNANNEFQAIATIKVGPVKARWKGKVRLSDLRGRRGRRSGLRQGWRHGRVVRQGWRHAPDLQRRSADRRQARSTWSAPDQQCREEDRRRFLHQIRRSGGGGWGSGGLIVRRQPPLTGPRGRCSELNLFQAAKRGRFDAILLQFPASSSGWGEKQGASPISGGTLCLPSR